MGELGFLGVVAALSAAPTVAPASRVELTADGSVVKSQWLGTDNPSSHGGGAGLTLTIYAQHPLVDDDAPYSLQPFLQRAGIVWLQADGGATGVDDDLAGNSANSSYGGAEAGFDLYVHRMVALNASFHVLGSHTDGQTLGSGDRLELDGHAGIGLRFGDARLDLGYSLGGTHTRFGWGPIYYGGVHLGANLVIARQLAFTAGASVIDGGLIVSVQLLAFFTRKVGVVFGLSGGGANRDGTTFATAGGTVGVTGWFSRHLGLAFRYTPTWSNGPGDGIIFHSFSVAVTSRVR